MQLLQIQIKTNPSVLAYNRTPSEMTIKQDHQTLNLQTEKSELEMKTTHAKVFIDQSQCFDEAGLKSNGSLIADNASYGMQKGMEAIGKIVDQGNQMADIASKVDPIPDQANYNAYEQFIRDWNMVTMPRSRPKFDIQEGRVDFNFKPAKVNNNTVNTKPEINYRRGRLDIYVKQYSSINISFINLKG